MKPFQDGGAVTEKVKSGIKFPNPLKQLKVQQIQLKQIEYWSLIRVCNKPCLAWSEPSVKGPLCMGFRLSSQKAVLVGCWCAYALGFSTKVQTWAR